MSFCFWTFISPSLTSLLCSLSSDGLVRIVGGIIFSLRLSVESGAVCLFRFIFLTALSLGSLTDLFILLLHFIPSSAVRSERAAAQILSTSSSACRIDAIKRLQSDLMCFYIRHHICQRIMQGFMYTSDFTMAKNCFLATWQQSSPYLLSSCMFLVLLCKDSLVLNNTKKEIFLFRWHTKLFNLSIMACNSTIQSIPSENT